MIKIFRSAILIAAISILLPVAASAATADPASAAALQAKFVELGPRLAHNPFKRPLVLLSDASSSALKGDVYAVVDHPFDQVSSSLNGPSHWCDVLILHLNTKYCRAVNGVAGTTLNVSVGKKFDQPLEDAYRVAFTYRQGAITPDYFDAHLDAKKGPLGTSDYLILLEATAIPGNKTFLHLTYSYVVGFASKVAMQGYLATAGSDKVGFTTSGKTSDGQPTYIGGMRGLVERNTMRYYLAIDAFLDTAVPSGPQQVDKRLQQWFDATENYPRQLHEMDRADYLAMKHNEIRRQQSAE
jgi:hypothetical protein